MELQLTFRQGTLQGEGRDLIGPFVIRGRYQVEDGQCWWTKRYIGKHDVSYRGYNEGKGIWGLWEIPPSWKGGFHIWPEGMGDPTRPRLAEALEEPHDGPGQDFGLEAEVGVHEEVTVGVETN
jgi:hypothetical protein